MRGHGRSNFSGCGAGFGGEKKIFYSITIAGLNGKAVAAFA